MTKTSKTDTCPNCGKKHDFSETKTHFHKGSSNKIALVFSCPGSEEEKEEKPVAGSTGKKLEALLAAMSKNSKLKEYKCRYDFRITNAWDKVETIEKTGRTEAKDSEIGKCKNLIRLQKELCDITGYIICFGRKAEKALSKLSLMEETPLKAKVIENIMHPSRKNEEKWVKNAVKILNKELK